MPNIIDLIAQDSKASNISQEIKAGIIPDPDAIDPITGEPLPPGTEEDVMAMGGGPEDAAAAAITNDQLNKDSKLAEI